LCDRVPQLFEECGDDGEGIIVSRLVFGREGLDGEIAAVVGGANDFEKPG